MNKLFLLILLAVSSLMVGCSASTNGVVTSPNRLPESTITNTEDTSGYMPPENSTWVYPGKVNIGNFYPGARAEYPLTIHNGNLVTRDTKTVTTETGEIQINMPLDSPIYSGELADFVIASDCLSDNLHLDFANLQSNEVTLSGLQENATRIITIDYLAYTKFAVYYQSTDNTAEGFVPAPIEAKDWVVIDVSGLLFAPRETKDIMISLNMPKDAESPSNKWEFWIGAKDVSQTAMIQTSVYVRFLITMRI